MASACVNNIGVVPDNFRNIGWLSPRISFGRDSKIPDSLKPDLGSPAKDSSSAATAVGDFEFCLHDDPVTMLPADELFSDGKLVPLHFPKPTTTTTKAVAIEDDVLPPEKEKASRVSCDGVDQYMFSPKAPRCSSRWREFLGLKNKKLPQNATAAAVKTSSSLPTTTSKSIRHFLHRNSRMSTSSLSSSTSLAADPSLSLPLLNHRSSDSSIDCESTFSISSSSRLSLSSSSSSGHDHEDLPRLSLDDNKPREPFRSFSRPRVRHVRPRMVPVENPNPKPLIDHPSAPNVSCRTGRTRHQDPTQTQTRGVSVDSPRMNPSGKIVFQSLERSSSSPSTFNGGPRYKYRGMERSYSANVRVTPVLNVPVCSLRGSSKSGGFGFGQLFSSSTSSGQRREKETNSNNGGIGGSSRNYHQHHNHRRKESS